MKLIGWKNSSPYPYNDSHIFFSFHKLLVCVCVDEKFSLSRNADKKDAAARDRSLKKKGRR